MTYPLNSIVNVDCMAGLRSLPTGSVQCCVTSPPYWRQRDYEVNGQYGMEPDPESYITRLTAVFEEVFRVLRMDGVLWLVIGDAYWGSGKAGRDAGYRQRHTEFGRISKRQKSFGLPVQGKHPVIKAKDLIGLPWMLAFKLREKGWYLRQDIIWHKSNQMPESVRDRCTRAHEYVFLFSKSCRYFYDQEAIKIPAAGFGHADGTVHGMAEGLTVNKRSVWQIRTRPPHLAHSAMFPEELILDCIKAGSRPGDVVLDPFMGAGTTALSCVRLMRHYIGFELRPDYIEIAKQRLTHFISENHV